MQIHLKLSHKKALQHLLDIEMEFEHQGGPLEFHLPKYRPGRYEAGDFPSRIRGLRVIAEDSDTIPYQKIATHTWSCDEVKAGQVKLCYEYYADTLNAGSTYLDADRMYVNPVNVIVHPAGQMAAKVIVDFDIPEDFKYSGMLAPRKGQLKAKHFDELYDSPFTWSRCLQVHSFKVGDIRTEVAIDGDAPMDKERIERDFTAFMETQVKAFGDCPVKRYVYLIMATPQRYYHGVEHEQGTVIALGPGRALMRDDIYQDLLGVSSHEFYHTWNVKYMRPKEMYPYDFDSVLHTRAGYIIEGVTTYQGDVKLWQSGVTDDAQFIKELKTWMDRHVHNPGRYNESVRESSFDLWVDGYVRGIPDKKVSIYNEGALLAFLTDIMLQEKSKGKVDLDTVMHELYAWAKENDRGYDEQVYLDILSKHLGRKWMNFYQKHIDGRGSLEDILIRAFKWIGIQAKAHAIDTLASRYGIRVDGSPQPRVLAVHPCSPAYDAGVHRDMILMAIDGQWVEGDAEALVSSEQSELLFKRGKEVHEVTLQASEHLLFRQYELTMAKSNARWKRWRQRYSG